MRALKYVVMSLLSGMFVAIFFVWVLFVHFGVIIGVDFWSALAISPIFAVDSHNMDAVARDFLIAGAFVGVVFSVASPMAFVAFRRIRAEAATGSTHSDYTYAGDFSDSGSDSGFSD